MDERIHFDGWTLLRSTGELTRGTARVRLQGQPLETLEALLERPGELVTREQLIARLWPRGVVVDFDTALNSAVRRLRTALDDHADQPRYIETIPRRGYRFIARITADAPGTADVAALPDSSALRPDPPPDIRPRRGNRLAWAAAAALTLMGATLWLPGVLSTPDAAAAKAPAAVAVPAEARERYERGRFFFGRRGEGDTARALALFQSALRADPALAAAWAGIASVHWIDTMEGRQSLAEGLPLVRAAVERALSLDPQNGEALIRLTNYHWASGDRAAAAAAQERAMTLAPDDPLVLTMRSDRARSAGRIDEAVLLQRRAVQSDPLAIVPRHNLVVLLFIARRYDEARAEFRELSAISPPRWPPDAVIGQSLLLGGDAAGALEYARTLPDGVVREQLEALSYFALDRAAEADAALQRLAANPSKSTAYRVAEVHAYRGETDAAFTWLRRGVGANDDDCPAAECWPENWVAELPLLRTLHADPRWPAIHAALVNSPVRPRRS